MIYSIVDIFDNQSISRQVTLVSSNFLLDKRQFEQGHLHEKITSRYLKTWNIYDGVLCENSYWILAAHYFCKKAQW